MARIRSIHPGLFTDEAFVSISADAQVFLMGLWTEADDQGLFEWKPVTLRMRLRPTKDGSVDGLLEELRAANFIQGYELGGRQYGAVRNFRKYQRPKKPNSVHPITEEIRTYVGLSNASSELSPQREDGGDKMEEEGGGGEPARARASPISGDWKPSAETVAKAQSDGLTADDISKMVARFVPHYRARGDCRVDWDAQFQAWTVDEAKKLGRKSAATIAAVPKKIHHKAGTEPWNAWCKYLGKTPPQDKNFGWYFDSEWPPGQEPKPAAA